ncbi:biliverdin-producing heme oxygenase [Blastococcus sp. HT6-30]|uniref:biliverdin-producing heme oxygenase n=1 Tax=Blastococcus sp. HT6-30 TaxID=3144843 RepID=UPI00321B0374
MAAGETGAHQEDHRSGADDVLRRLRTGTAEEHQALEDTLDLLDPELDRDRLAQVLGLMHGFWAAAEAGLDGWAARRPADAGTVDWTRRRRAGLFAADLAALGAPVPAAAPALPPVAGTDEALGRLYVLEGSTLGGTFIDRHLAGLPRLSGVRIRAFSPYGPETGAMWAAYRRATREHVATGGDVERIVSAARETFGALAAWCRPAARAQVAPG